MNCPVAIGAVLWAPRVTPEPINVICPVCAGARYLVVILGDGDQVAVECSACESGYHGPQGTIREWMHAPNAARFTVDSIVSFDVRDGKERWRLRSEEGGESDFSDLFATEADALAHSEKRAAEHQDAQMGARKRLRVPKDSKLSRIGFTVYHHRREIADLQRKLEWHAARVKKVDYKRLERDAKNGENGGQD